jgi:hypothetical protein
MSVTELPMSRVFPVMVGRVAELATLNAAPEHVCRGD